MEERKMLEMIDDEEKISFPCIQQIGFEEFDSSKKKFVCLIVECIRNQIENSRSLKNTQKKLDR